MTRGLTVTAERRDTVSSKSFEFIIRNGDGHGHRVAWGSPSLFEAGKRQNYFEIISRRKIRVKTRTSCPQPASFPVVLLQIKFAGGNFFRLPTNQSLWVFLMLLSYTAVEFMQRFRFSSEQGALISALGDTTGGGPAPKIQLVWGPGAGEMFSSNCGTLKSDVWGGVADESIRTVGRFQYRLNFKDVWVEDEPFNLRGHLKAQFCLKCLVDHLAFNINSGVHFLTEIDPYVRIHSGSIKLATIQIKDYFREPTGQLARLRRMLIKSAGKNGKYYLLTGAD